MDIVGRRVMVLGGWGLVGSAICRALVSEEPRAVILTSLRRWQTEEELAILRAEFPDAPVAFLGEWGDVFARAEHKDMPREEVLADGDRRASVVRDVLGALEPGRYRDSFLYQIIHKHQPEIIIDCINSATAFAYQDIFKSGREAIEAIEEYPKTQDFGTLQFAVERFLATAYIPQLIRHVQTLHHAMKQVRTRIYVKIGTSGTGGMGLNIPYTHSEERPSPVLLAKAAVAGAHTLLLFLMARTPGGPIIKELKPAALIGWKTIAHGAVRSGDRPMRLFDCPPDHAVTLEGTFSSAPPPRLAEVFERQPERTLESVFIDTGENGIFAAEEFEAVTTIGQMEFVTPEEIAQAVIFEIKGGNTGHDIINSLDQACMGPTYRAGVMRSKALARMHQLEREHGEDSVAFEQLGPPKLTKILYEAYILGRQENDLERLATLDAPTMCRFATELLETDASLRSRILSVGIPILLPDGRRLLRGPVVKIPALKGKKELPITPEMIDRWAEEGWVDLRRQNFDVWRHRIRRIIADLTAIEPDDTSSRHERNRAFWFGDSGFSAGKLAGWILSIEDQGARMKS